MHDQFDSASHVRPPHHQQDLQLVQRVLSGSETDWHRLVGAHTNLIQAVLRKYLDTEEEVRDVFADTLEKLHGGKLKTFNGESKLSTWLYLVARNMALDHVRKQVGRVPTPVTLKKLSTFDQAVFEAFFEKKLSFSEVKDHLRAKLETEATTEAILESIKRLESSVDSRVFRRLERRVSTGSRGYAMGQLLEWLEASKHESYRRQQDTNPEKLMINKEFEALKETILNLVKTLPQEDQEILNLRFSEKMTGKEIAAILKLKDSKQSYRLINRILLKLRKDIQLPGAAKAKRP